MKDFKLKISAIVCALLSVVLIGSLAACGVDEGGLTLNSYSLTIDAGSTSPLLVTSTPSEDVVWTSSDESIVTVAGSNTGNRMCTVTAVAVGSATVTARAGSDVATCEVTVIEAEVVTITLSGKEVSEITLEENGTAQFAASSNREHELEWESDKPKIATVSASGLVTAVAPSGTVTITARCAQHTDVYATVKVVVGSGVDAVYDIVNGDENGSFGNKVNSNDMPGVWLYWNQYGNVANAEYNRGVVSFDTINVSKEDNPVWYNVQLFYTAAATDKDSAGNALKANTLYALTFDMTTTMAGNITVNGYVLHLDEGENHLTAYYIHTATAFALQLGVEGEGVDITNAHFTISNLVWTVSSQIELDAPAFSINNSNVITIQDDNPNGSVSSYILILYNNENKPIGSMPVTNGATVDTSKIGYNGTFNAKLKAIAANALYTDSAEATSNNATITVQNEEVKYTIEAGGADRAVNEIGVWTYWTEYWVHFSGSVTDGEADITFDTNTGNWYDTQLFYKMPGVAEKEVYNVTLHINGLAKDGRITINQDTVELKAGDNAIDLTITEGSGASIIIVFGVDGENKQQDFGAVEHIKISITTGSTDTTPEATE